MLPPHPMMAGQLSATQVGQEHLTNGHSVIEQLPPATQTSEVLHAVTMENGGQIIQHPGSPPHLIVRSGEHTPIPHPSPTPNDQPHTQPPTPIQVAMGSGTIMETDQDLIATTTNTVVINGHATPIPSPNTTTVVSESCVMGQPMLQQQFKSEMS